MHVVNQTKNLYKRVREAYADAPSNTKILKHHDKRDAALRQSCCFCVNEAKETACWCNKSLL